MMLEGEKAIVRFTEEGAPAVTSEDTVPACLVAQCHQGGGIAKLFKMPFAFPESRPS